MPAAVRCPSVTSIGISSTPWWAVSAGYLGDFLLRGRDTALKEECPND